MEQGKGKEKEKRIQLRRLEEDGRNVEYVYSSEDSGHIGRFRCVVGRWDKLRGERRGSHRGMA